jgi:hypothetical protein
MQPEGYLEWNLDEISKAQKITKEDVRLYFTDGRRVSFILERRICYEVVKGRLAPSEGAGFDLYDSQDYKWEVRSITKDGIYFCPSYMVGSGRRFEEQGFLNKLDEIKGYIVSDVESFPKVPFWKIDKDIVYDWWINGTLGNSTKITRKKALNLIEKI